MAIDHPIHALWATPRSTSTAFEWMMRMRGDLACFHEPFGEAWYQGDDSCAPQLTAEWSRHRWSQSGPSTITSSRADAFCACAFAGAYSSL